MNVLKYLKGFWGTFFFKKKQEISGMLHKFDFLNIFVICLRTLKLNILETGTLLTIITHIV